MDNTAAPAGQPGLFRRDSTTGGEASVESWVVLTTLLLLAKFAVGSIGPRISSRRSVAVGTRLLHILNYYSVSYTLGLMSPSSSSDRAAVTVNDFFQVWAVLIVTMQDSVRIGRPYRPKEMTLIDLLDSLWSANLLRQQSEMRLKVPLWFMWSIHASRIVWYYVSSNRATEAGIGNIKLVSDYMVTLQHTDDDPSPAGEMSMFKYIVVGEDEHTLVVRPPGFTLEMEVSEPNKATRLLTVDKVWEQARDHGDRLLSTAADRDSRFKDVCLSFALYKLQRRRFFNFPIAEATHPATRRLVSDAILAGESATSYERALRITEVELSFLHDSLYSKHAAVFSGGFPRVRLALSLLMAAAALYLVYAVRGIPSIGAAVTGDKKVAVITHGVAVTHCIIGIIVYRELLEVAIYVLSQWTKVWAICHYIELKGTQGRLMAARRVMMEMVVRAMFLVIRRGHWDQRIRQHNLLMSAVNKRSSARPVVLRKVKLQSEVKGVVFQSLKSLVDTPLPSADPSSYQQRMNSLLMSYSRTAFPIPAAHGSSPSKQPVVEGAAGDLEGETHKILVWHIATSLCQIKLLEDAGERGGDLYTLPKTPFAGELAAAWPGYVAAVSLSNYCAYLVSQALVPDNGLVANKVFDAVRGETCDAVRGCGGRAANLTEFRDRLVKLARDDGDGEGGETIVGMSARLSEKLESMYGTEELWRRLGRFWAGFLLHLSASTRAAKHRIHLQGRGELTTHLWVLLSHAGFLGRTSHGEQLLDPEDLNDA